MKNDNKQRGDTGRTQNPTRQNEQKPAQTPVKQGDQGNQGNRTGSEKEPNTGREGRDERHKETDPATAPSKTRENPKGR